MGSALTAAAVTSGRTVTVWNRDRAKADHLAGVTVADSPADAIRASDVVVVCLLDHASVHAVLDPVAHAVRGRHVVNVTTMTPAEARALADWTGNLGAEYLDGGVMAVPEMIGTPAGEVLYSGSADVFDAHRGLLESWCRAEYLGTDAGAAALYDLALLAGMYSMFAGFFHGAAMVGTAGVSATEFAGRATPWLQAMADGLADFAAVVDAEDYGAAGQQSLHFSDPRYIVTASRDAGVRTDLIDAVRALVLRQIDAGHGADGFARVIESFRGAA